MEAMTKTAPAGHSNNGHGQPGTGGMKAWAREMMNGLETILMPSFTPDMAGLDAEGIAHDVEQSKRHGFFSVFCPSVGLTPDEHIAFVRIAAEAAGGEIAVSLSAGFENDADPVDAVRRAADAGASHALVHPPFHWKPTDEAELLGYYQRVIDNSPIPAVLWATDGPNFRHFAPGNVPINVIDRLADSDKVVAIKLMATLDEAITTELCERTAGRLLIGCVNLRQFPDLSRKYGAQWSGAWTGEALQSPEKPLVTQYIRQLNAHDYAAAEETFALLAPSYGMLFQMMAPLLPKGVHPFTQLKYYQWYVGGNGGLMRTPHDPIEAAFKLTPEQRENVAKGFAMLGIEGAGGDRESFITGRAAYARGVRTGDVQAEARAIYV